MRLLICKWDSYFCLTEFSSSVRFLTFFEWDLDSYEWTLFFESLLLVIKKLL